MTKNGLLDGTTETGGIGHAGKKQEAQEMGRSAELHTGTITLGAIGMAIKR
jgi:hypothetical protein